MLTTQYPANIHSFSCRDDRTTPQGCVVNELDSRINGFDRLVEALANILGPASGIDSDDVNENDLIELMRAYTSMENEWCQYALADASRNYTRNLVDEGNGKSNLLILVWNPGKGSPIHDHANAHCVMKILKGRLQESLYTHPVRDQEMDSTQSPPELMRQRTYSENEVTYISDTIGLHKIENPSASEVAISLHLYTPPHAANFGFHLFDEKTGRSTHIKQSQFFSNRGIRMAM